MLYHSIERRRPIILAHFAFFYVAITCTYICNGCSFFPVMLTLTCNARWKEALEILREMEANDHVSVSTQCAGDIDLDTPPQRQCRDLRYCTFVMLVPLCMLLLCVP